MLERFFKLKEHGTTVGTETMAGITTFFAMSYILFVNPMILSLTGMPSQAVFLATIFAAAIGTFIMGFFANVPYAQAPGMGLNAFFTYTVCFSLGFSWQEALALVFICGMINIIITVTKFRRLIIKAIPETLQHAIGGGIGVFIAYVGLKNANLLSFSADSGAITSINGQAYQAATAVGEVTNVVANGGIVPSLANFTNPAIILGLIGLILMLVLVVKKVKGAVFIGIIVTTLIDIPLGVTDFSGINLSFSSIGSAFSELGITFGAAFSAEGFGALLADPSRFPMILITVFAFSLSDTFDTIGTFIGTGRRTGIFSEEDEQSLENGKGFKTKMDKALFADAVATSIGAVLGTSNTTTFVESAAGIGAGGRTGLTSVVTGCLFLISILLAPVVGVIPPEATSAALILVGIMMLASFTEIDWTNFDEAVPAFFASIFMGLAYNISYGIAAGFIFYCLIKLITGKAKEVHPILWGVSTLFIMNFVVMAYI